MTPFDFYVRHEYAFAATQLVLLMFGMGAALAARDVAEVISRPRGLAMGLALQLIVVPLIAAAFIALLARDAGMAVGLALCAAVPGAAIASVFALFARGHLALTVVLTTGATLACLLTTPAVLGLLAAGHTTGEIRMPVARIAIEIGLYLLLPLLIGMGLLRAAPHHAPRISRICVRASLLIIVLIVVGASGAGRLDTDAFGNHNVGVVLLFIGTLAALSALLPQLMGLPRTEIAAINLATTVRNTNIGLLIKASAFPAAVGVADPVGDNALFAVLLYGGLSLIAGPLLALLHRSLGATAAVAARGSGT